jgi:hypothetical protein
VQEERVGSQPAGQRRSGEDRQPEHEDEPAADLVGQRPRRQQHAREGQRVGVDHPLEVAEVGAEVALDRRQRDVHDRHVEQKHEDRDTAREQLPPPAFHSIPRLHAG